VKRADDERAKQLAQKDAEAKAAAEALAKALADKDADAQKRLEGAAQHEAEALRQQAAAHDGKLAQVAAAHQGALADAQVRSRNPPRQVRLQLRSCCLRMFCLC
jgi:hypothetical protein